MKIKKKKTTPFGADETPAPKEASSGVGVKAAGKPAVTAEANPQMVAALRSLDGIKEEARTYLVKVIDLYKELKLTKAQMIASMMEARGITYKTAESQFSRMNKIIKDPATLQALQAGDIDFTTARARTTKPQENPSENVRQQNRERRWTSVVSQLVTIAKELGLPRKDVLDAIDASLRAAKVA